MEEELKRLKAEREILGSALYKTMDALRKIENSDTDGWSNLEDVAHAALNEARSSVDSLGVVFH